MIDAIGTSPSFDYAALESMREAMNARAATNVAESSAVSQATEISAEALSSQNTQSSSENSNQQQSSANVPSYEEQANAFKQNATKNVSDFATAQAITGSNIQAYSALQNNTQGVQTNQAVQINQVNANEKAHSSKNIQAQQSTQGTQGIEGTSFANSALATAFSNFSPVSFAAFGPSTGNAQSGYLNPNMAQAPEASAVAAKYGNNTGKQYPIANSYQPISRYV